MRARLADRCDQARAAVANALGAVRIFGEHATLSTDHRLARCARPDRESFPALRAKRIFIELVFAKAGHLLNILRSLYGGRPPRDATAQSSTWEIFCR